MKKKLKVLHVASFIGNIGDTANHIGAAYLRSKYLDYDFCITKKEIREFYWREWIFNSDEFVIEANLYDLIMIGGGNYFELWVEESVTGTSIDIGLEYLSKINTPILFYALGCDIGKGIPSENIIKFKKFMDYLTSNSKYFISIRNDGALENIQSIYGDLYRDKIVELPDAGFFTRVKNILHCELEKNKTNIIINIAGDMLETRFMEESGDISYNTFIDKFANLIENLSEQYNDKLNIIFVTHMFKDNKVICDIMDKIKDRIRRKYIKISPYIMGEKGHDYIFSLYNQADLILAMRFHANVCSYAFGKNIIGLVNYIQILNLYNKGIYTDEFVEVNKEGFDNQLMDKIVQHLEKPDIYEELSKKVRNEMLLNAQKGYLKINNWLDLHFGGNKNEY